MGVPAQKARVRGRVLKQGQKVLRDLRKSFPSLPWGRGKTFAPCAWRGGCQRGLPFGLVHGWQRKVWQQVKIFRLTIAPKAINVWATNPPNRKVGFAEFLQDTGSLPD